MTDQFRKLGTAAEQFRASGLTRVSHDAIASANVRISPMTLFGSPVLLGSAGR